MSVLVTGLILAAGAGTRFASSGGGVKQVAILRGKPLLQWALDAQLAVDALERIIVVLGANADSIRPRMVLGRAEAVICDSWDQGLSASLKAGLAAVGDGQGVIVTLGDQPLVSPGLITRFLHEPAPARAVYDGRPGHPVLLGVAQVRRARTLTGDRGAASLLSSARMIDCTAFGVRADLDVDTVDDLTQLDGCESPLGAAGAWRRQARRLPSRSASRWRT